MIPSSELQHSLRLTEFTSRHVTQEYVAWLNSPATVRYSEQRHTTHTMESCERYRRSVAEKGDNFLAVELNKNGLWSHIGNITVAIDAPNAIAELSILIGNADCRGKGLGAFAWCLAAVGAFERLGVRKVLGGTMASNLPMRRIFAKTGMREVATVPGRFWMNHEETDLIIAQGYEEGFRRYLREH